MGEYKDKIKRGGRVKDAQQAGGKDSALCSPRFRENVLPREISVVSPPKEGEVWTGSWKGESLTSCEIYKGEMLQIELGV